MMRLYLWFLLCVNFRVWALPIGFDHHQQGIPYAEIQTSGFRVYYDSRFASEGAYIASSLERAKPLFETWFGIKRQDLLPVIVSGISRNASFANFLTDAIELQTDGPERALYWHELAHSMMYLHFYNFLGPAGSLIHLPWIPAWFIEGLAEAYAVSTGSDIQVGMERYHSLTGSWPSYDRLHDLYSSGKFALEGYATSGAFVRWLLAKLKPGELASLLARIKTYSWPTYYPFSLNPMSSFMPFDQAIFDFLAENPRNLYEQYKKERQNFWLARSSGIFLGKKLNEAQNFASVSGFFEKEGKPFIWLQEESQANLYALDEKKEQGFYLQDKKPVASLSQFLELSVYKNGMHFWSTEEANFLGEKTTNLYQEGRLLTKIKGAVNYLYPHQDGLVLLKRNFEEKSICTVHKNQTLFCQAHRDGLTNWRVLGEADHDTLWLLEIAPGGLVDTYNLFSLHIPSGKLSLLVKDFADARMLTRAKEQLYLLVATADGHVILEMDKNARPRKKLVLADLVIKMLGHDDGSLTLGVLAGSKKHLLRLDLVAMPFVVCAKDEKFAQGLSPMQQALKEKAFELENSMSKPVPAKYRLRPVLAFPWIGADDALGSQYGVISVPLMDEMQNETLRLTLLYGQASHYPNSQIDLTSTRFYPTLSLSLFRRQVFNGVFKDQFLRSKLSYLDEKGAQLGASYAWQFGATQLGLNLGVKKSYLAPYLGVPLESGFGNLTELYVGSKIAFPVARATLTLGLAARGTTEDLQDNFHYNELSLYSYLSERFRSLGDFKLGIGFEGARLRGKKAKTPHLKENYQALKTFVPGAGSSYSQNSLPLVGDLALFQNRYGDNQARLKLDGSYPLIKELEKQVWILYLKSLMASFFYNYGGAWWEQERYQERFVAASGYGLDLLVGNKGVALSAGLGVGQVFGRPFSFYANFGFDAVF